MSSPFAKFLSKAFLLVLVGGCSVADWATAPEGIKFKLLAFADNEKQASHDWLMYVQYHDSIGEPRIVNCANSTENRLEAFLCTCQPGDSLNILIGTDSSVVTVSVNGFFASKRDLPAQYFNYVVLTNWIDSLSELGPVFSPGPGVWISGEAPPVQLRAPRDKTVLAIWQGYDVNKVLRDTVAGASHPLAFQLSDDKQVIAGLHQALLYFRLPDERNVILAPEMAFGLTGLPEAGIPAHSPMWYRVRLLPYSEANDSASTGVSLPSGS